MAEHDLWNEDDFFEKLKKEKRAAEKPKSPEPEPEQESPLDQEPQEIDLFETQEPSFEEEKPQEEDIFAVSEDQEIKSELPEESEDRGKPEPKFEEESQQQEFAESIKHKEEPEEESHKYELSQDYEEEKLAPVNYKPVIIWAFIIILLIVLFFVLRGVFFKGRREENVPAKAQQIEQKQKTQKPAQNPMQIKRAKYLGQLAALNTYNMGLVQSIQTLINSQKAKLSNLLFYNDELTFEVFCKNRSQLAAVTVQLKNASNLNHIRLISSDKRPGDGISGVFYLKINKAITEGQPGPQIADVASLKQWLGMLGQQFSVKEKTFQEMGTSPVNLGLKRNRALVRLQGSYGSCLNFVNAIASAKRNIKIHKFVLSARDKKTFNKAKYQIELTLDLFM